MKGAGDGLQVSKEASLALGNPHHVRFHLNFDAIHWMFRYDLSDAHKIEDWKLNAARYVKGNDTLQVLHHWVVHVILKRFCGNFRWCDDVINDVWRFQRKPRWLSGTPAMSASTCFHPGTIGKSLNQIKKGNGIY